MKKTIIGLSCLIVSGCTASSDSIQPDKPHPFIGCWQSEDGLAREVWSADPSGWLFGYALNRDVDGEVTFFEQMRLDGDALYVSGPNDNVVRFEQVQAGPDYVFENLEHDFPQRITYLPSTGRLDARISLGSGEQKVAFAKRDCNK